MERRATALVFDVNETLLDLRALDEPFERVFGDASARTQWFGQLLQSALVATVTDSYTDFGSTALAALQMVAARHGRELTANEVSEILGTIRRLPPHPEVHNALDRLGAGGYRLATLTNSTEEVARATRARRPGIPLRTDPLRRLRPTSQAGS